jgi:hypothetical protein
VPFAARHRIQAARRVANRDQGLDVATPDQSYAGFTLDSFKAAVAPSTERRRQLAQHDALGREFIARRDEADLRSKNASSRAVNARNVLQGAGRRRATAKKQIAQAQSPTTDVRISGASMSTSFKLALTLAVLTGACSAAALAQAAKPHMAIVKNKDVTGQVLKRLGLPNQDYCWEQCLEDARCTGTRWGVIAGMTAGQCQLMSGELSVSELHSLKTEDGQRIVVTASRKVTGAAPGAEH